MSRLVLGEFVHCGLVEMWTTGFIREFRAILISRIRKTGTERFSTVCASKNELTKRLIRQRIDWVSATCSWISIFRARYLLISIK